MTTDGKATTGAGGATMEPQYDRLLEVERRHGRQPLGLMLNQAWYDDPKRLAFTFARYKFAARMLSGAENVLEVGCGDAFASRIVQQEVKRLSVTDFDPLFIEDARSRQVEAWNFADLFVHDILREPIPGRYDGIYALDVLEHIDPTDEDRFLTHVIAALAPSGTMLIGMPSLESQIHASPISKMGHANCQTLPQLKSTMSRYFSNVFMFCMNDEILHTGYHKMAHYLFALCCGKCSS